jgi:hypothetical protein
VNNDHLAMVAPLMVITRPAPFADAIVNLGMLPWGTWASGQQSRTDDHDPTLLSGLGPMIFAGGLGTGVDLEANFA